ncbi:metallophosphoesterase [Phenylobacterium sp.]|uniref:metallophosphoesterase family protein n=1 Tax=Phenylobacterium sp. TaxID=1871053 RepID=UPI0025F5DD7C|nr:metallophosphoesterase [Phenylobacterium sp.]
MRRWIVGLAAALAAVLPAAAGDFAPAPMKGPTPWTSTRFDDAPGDFTFAVVTDLESGYRTGVFDVAVEDLKLLRPAFVITVGDQIDGGTEDEALLEREWTEFDARLAGLKAPYFHVGGNHDLTNLTQRKVWERRYGARYYHFAYKGVLFLVLDTEDYSPARFAEIYRMRADYLATRETEPEKARTLPYASLMEAKVGEVGDAQSAYFEKVIAANPTARHVVVLMHKPVWRRAGPGGLGRIEAALKGRPYTVLNGHVHRYSHTEKDGRDYVTLGTTGGEWADNDSPGAFDHIMWVTVTKDGPSIANLRLDGVLDKTGKIPAGGDRLCLSRRGPNCPK